MAWLNSAPKPNDKEGSTKNRWNSLSDGHPDKCLPVTDDYIASLFSIVGPCLSTADGASPITWSEINAFISSSGYLLNGWECEQLVSMSRSYCSSLIASDKLNYPAPYREGVESDDKDAMQDMRDRVSKQWGSFK